MYILFGWPDPFTKAKPGRAHNPAPYIHSASCRCLWTTYIPQGQSAYKSHLPLLNALERVPVTDWSADLGQAWVLGKEDHHNSRTVLTTIHMSMLVAYSTMQHKLLIPPLGLSDAHTHVCAVWMHDGSSLNPGLMAEPRYTPTGPRTPRIGTGEAETEQWRGSGHQAQPMQVWSNY